MNRGAADPVGATKLGAAAGALLASLASLPDDRRDGGLLLAVSGGPDSLGLLLAAAALRAAGRFDRPVAVATVDHALRPESAAEAEAVARIAAALGFPHRTLRWHRDSPLMGNLSAQARAARYRLLGAHARRIGAGLLATAHHLDDQIETHLLARTRGADGAALAAMRSWRDLQPGLVLVRPFLSLRKRDLIALVEAAGLEAADDPSNRDLRFARARLRAAPRGAEEEAAMLEAIAHAAALRSEEDAALAARFQALADANCLCVSPLGEVELARGEADAALLSRAVTAAGGAHYPPARAPLQRLALRIATEGEGAATLGGARLVWRGDRLTVSREYGREGPPDLLWPSGESSACFDGRFDIEAPPEGCRLIAARGRRGGGMLRHRTLPEALDDSGMVIARHPALPSRKGEVAVPLAVSCRVGWRLCADLAFAARSALTGRLQNAANHGEPVGKGMAYTYIPGQVEASCVEGRMVARAHFQDG